MLSTDLVPVHNDIWRKLPFSSWRDFRPDHEPFTEKVTKAVTFNIDPGMFLYLPAFVLKQLTSGVFLHFHWSNALNLICEPAGSISKFGKHEVLQRLISSPLPTTTTQHVFRLHSETEAPPNMTKESYRTSIVGATERSLQDDGRGG